jgi:hypothetical protein
MGAAGATNQIVKESHSDLGWDFFYLWINPRYNEWIIFQC